MRDRDYLNRAQRESFVGLFVIADYLRNTVLPAYCKDKPAHKWLASAATFMHKAVEAILNRLGTVEKDRLCRYSQGLKVRLEYTERERLRLERLCRALDIEDLYQFAEYAIAGWCWRECRARGAAVEACPLRTLMVKMEVPVVGERVAGGCEWQKGDDNGKAASKKAS